LEVPVIVTTFPRTVRVIEHTLIPLKDGTMLAARIWLPDDAEQNPVPAILEYLPYRKRDGTYERDALSHPYLAGHGYAGFASILEVAASRMAHCSTSTQNKNRTMAWR
jgi:predicted acyl esterase